MIPDAAVEAAKEAMREVTPPAGVSKADWLAKYGEWALLAGAISAALEAAVPQMLAKAWESGHRTCRLDPDSIEFNPYRPTK